MFVRRERAHKNSINTRQAVRNRTTGTADQAHRIYHHITRETKRTQPPILRSPADHTHDHTTRQTRARSACRRAGVTADTHDTRGDTHHTVPRLPRARPTLMPTVHGRMVQSPLPSTYPSCTHPPMHACDWGMGCGRMLAPAHCLGLPRARLRPPGTMSCPPTHARSMAVCTRPSGTRR
jgi:hypothetical protein